MKTTYTDRAPAQKSPAKLKTLSSLLLPCHQVRARHMPEHRQARFSGRSRPLSPAIPVTPHIRRLPRSPTSRRPFLSLLETLESKRPEASCFSTAMTPTSFPPRPLTFPNDGMEDRYSILIRFDSQDSTDDFYKHFNGSRFSSLEVEACRILFTVDVQYTGSIEHAQASSGSSTEQPSCPVCLERLDQDMGGILTTICNHSFHCSCISKWTDSSCPIVNEYNELLATQLENQKVYFELLLQEVKEETEREISNAVEKAVPLKKMQAKLDRCVKEKKFLDDLNENLLKNQEIWKAKILEAEERNLMLYLETGKTMEQTSISNE
ncbi:zinc finger C3HC4-type RING finger family protein [Prunus dulcis]|uniref:Zinc finger C3HC4-type RING finger family protein n=1 Tax=Prunus dulcis TaxID=3755 RepID=A0A4Y1R4Z0_PRUDU|nr:zinc finger C3HC4-type RING finger family protein [Prunus dulcis]